MSSFFECFNNFVQSGGNVAQNVSQEEEQKIAAQPLDGEKELVPPTSPTPSESSEQILDSLGGASASYYVVKAGSLGSAASMTGSIKVSSPPKAPPAIKSPALIITSPATPTESSSTISAPSESSFGEKMEHSYMRDPPVRSEVNNGLMPTRNILVRHPPQCPSCHTYPQHEELAELQQAHVPPYDEIAAKEAMN
ncbi:hypothetical protein M5D96_010287 [Drosophila gunungcola]|uniref:Uncharacterized protein n=1 Tax=Drosophila gunungcola TaxID=103775 RepID=A0A9P9YHB1_9MUSC|nr:hypothetical protein M5D96_010287 [Drosophila gunungcola]